MNFGLAASVLASSHSAFASDWGSCKNNGCVNLGNDRTARSYSAVLWNIPWGESWENACSNKDAWVADQYFSHPTVCAKASAASAIGSIGGLFSVAGLVFPPAGVAEDNCQDSPSDW